MIILSFFLFLLIKNTSCNTEVKDVEVLLNDVLNFVHKKIDQFGFDGIFGITLAESQLTQILNLPLPHGRLKDVKYLITKCQNILIKAKSFLPKYPPYMLIFQNRLLNAKNWVNTLPNNITFGEIPDLGIYKDWSSAKILNNKKAEFRGVRSDICLQELLEQSSDTTCVISKICQEMMLNISRVDTGYLLTHRLLYIQIKRLQGCRIIGNVIRTNEYTRLFCSYIYKEAKTSEHLGYPYHDIFLEQVVLCGMEGYSEFLKEHWLENILRWQNPHGCYESVKRQVEKRTSKVVGYGCSDHSTGLGAAALALHLKYLYMK